MAHSPMFTVYSDISQVRSEIYLLLPGERLENFGGSVHALIVEKTPSLVLRQINNKSGEQADEEFEINDPNIWKGIIKAICRIDTFVRAADGELI